MKVIVWGLRTKKHTHRFIHRGFYDALRRMSVDALWLDDLEKNAALISPGALVISVDVASEHLPYRKDVKFVLHNVTREAFRGNPT